MLNGAWLDEPPRHTIHERFLKYVAQQPDGCWLWTGFQTGNGYGGFYVRSLYGRQGKVQAHRWAYTYYKGPIEPGKVIDHICQRKLCVNPDHLEVVTHSENLKRAHARKPRGFPEQVARGVSKRKPVDQGYYCNSGLHEWTTENIWETKRGTRYCRPCKQARERERTLRLRSPE